MMFKIPRSTFKKKSIILSFGNLLSEQFRQMLNPRTSNISRSAKLLEVQGSSRFLNFVLKLCF